jgi:hypothetical protein
LPELFFFVIPENALFRNRLGGAGNVHLSGIQFAFFSAENLDSGFSLRSPRNDETLNKAQLHRPLTAGPRPLITASSLQPLPVA